MADTIRQEVGGRELRALVVTSATEGASSDAAWDGSEPDASMVAILKAIHAQNETIIAHLAAIEANTDA